MYYLVNIIARLWDSYNSDNKKQEIELCLECGYYYAIVLESKEEIKEHNITIL